MEKYWIIIVALLIFLGFTFLYWRLTHKYAKKKYGIKIWKHWPMRFSYWQGAIMYSVGFTVITLFLLRWGNILTF